MLSNTSRYVREEQDVLELTTAVRLFFGGMRIGLEESGRMAYDSNDEVYARLCRAEIEAIEAIESLNLPRLTA